MNATTRMSARTNAHISSWVAVGVAWLALLVVGAALALSARA